MSGRGGARSEHLPKLKALGKQLRKTEVHKSWVPEFWSLSLSAFCRGISHVIMLKMYGNDFIFSSIWNPVLLNVYGRLLGNRGEEEHS